MRNRMFGDDSQHVVPLWKTLRSSILLFLMGCVTILSLGCGNFEIGLEPTPTPTPSILRYENTDYGFAFTYPSHWTLEEETHIIAGFHAAAAATARAGNLVIIDDVLEENPPWIESLLTLFEGIEVIFVGVYCPLEELEGREQARGNRKPGQARIPFE